MKRLRRVWLWWSAATHSDIDDGGFAALDPGHPDPLVEQEIPSRAKGFPIGDHAA
jgi:hypothetical protein